MTGSTIYAADEADIRALIEAKMSATRAKDAAGATARFAPSAVSFDVVDPLRYAGADAIRKRAESWFATFQGPIGYEIHELAIAVGDSVAFAHTLNHVRGTLLTGQSLEMWWRETTGFEKVDGQWMITHVHDSVPFNPETGKPSVGLSP